MVYKRALPPAAVTFSERSNRSEERQLDKRAVMDLPKDSSAEFATLSGGNNGTLIPKTRYQGGRVRAQALFGVISAASNGRDKSEPRSDIPTQRK